MLQFIELDGQRRDNVDIQVNDTPKVVRHAFGDGRLSHGAEFPSYLLMVFGASGVLGTLVMLPFALQNEDDGSASSLRTPVLIGLGSSAAAVLLSIPLILLSRDTYQPGSTTEFPLGR